MLLLWCAPLMAEVAWLDWVRLDWRMRYVLLDADGDEREVILSLIKAIHVFLTQSDKDKDCKVLSSLPFLPVRLYALRSFDPAWLLHVPAACPCSCRRACSWVWYDAADRGWGSLLRRPCWWQCAWICS